jgi:hypothetical protein
MAKATPILEKRSTSGDAAVSGLFAGLGAGALMIGFLALAGLLAGQGHGITPGILRRGKRRRCRVAHAPGCLRGAACSMVLAWRLGKTRQPRAGLDDRDGIRICCGPWPDRPPARLRRPAGDPARVVRLRMRLRLALGA